MNAICGGIARYSSLRASSLSGRIRFQTLSSMHLRLSISRKGETVSELSKDPGLDWADNVECALTASRDR